MDITKILNELRQHLAAVNVSIAALEGVEAGKPRRGRPPKWVTKAKGPEGTKRGGQPAAKRT